MPKLPPLTKDQAQAIMELTRKIARYGRQQSKARKVLRAGRRGQRLARARLARRRRQGRRRPPRRPGDQDQRRPRSAGDGRVAKSNPGKVRYQRALRDGAYNSVDAFVNAVLGVSAIPKQVGDLLGPAGTAQLGVHAIRKHGGVDMQKALDALDEHTQRQEQTVAQTALARARSAADMCVQMREERKLSQAGQSLWLQTMTYSYEQEKMGEAARLLGMGIGGMEATSALKVALTAPPTGSRSAGSSRPRRSSSSPRRPG
jgi:hypothetical protein